MFRDSSQKKKKMSDFFYYLAVTSDDLVQQESPIVAIVSLPAANNDISILEQNGKRRNISCISKI